MTALNRRRSASRSPGASLRTNPAASVLPSVLAHPVHLAHEHILNAGPRPVPCLWLRPCNGVQLPGGSSGAQTHRDLSARACQPLGSSRSRTPFLVLTCCICASSQMECAGWRSSPLSNEDSFGIFLSSLTLPLSEATRADGAPGRCRARERFSACGG